MQELDDKGLQGKGDALECRSYRGIELLEHVMKILERVIEGRVKQIVKIDDMQFGFMAGNGTTDAILLFDSFKKSIWGRKRICVWRLLIWKRLSIEFHVRWCGGRGKSRSR